MRARGLAVIAAAVVAASAGSAFGVSDGNYSPRPMHCSGAANNVESPKRAEPGCHNGTITISDGAGHEYFGIGVVQTAAGEEGVVPGGLPFDVFSNIHEFDWWYDFGDGCTRYTFDVKEPAPPEGGPCPWVNRRAPNYSGRPVAPDPSKGLRIYMGFDDNMAGGEHDSSELINNGPSDGGAIRLELDPASVSRWLEEFAAANPAYLLTHPLPAGDFGVGFCVDGICMSAQTQRRVAYRGGAHSQRHVANYEGKRWDPEGCSGNDDGSKGNHCDDPKKAKSQDIRHWHGQDGTVYVEPGVQIYEDPDPQASPLGPYPLPALYIGPCGVVIGGGPGAQMPPSPFTNPKSGQVVLETACA
jgi:hypothetical protein